MTHYRNLVQTFWCDALDCLNSYELLGARRAETWAEARSAGWRERDGKHLCPVHSSPISGSADE